MLKWSKMTNCSSWNPHENRFLLRFSFLAARFFADLAPAPSKRILPAQLTWKWPELLLVSVGNQSVLVTENETNCFGLWYDISWSFLIFGQVWSDGVWQRPPWPRLLDLTLNLAPWSLRCKEEKDGKSVLTRQQDKLVFLNWGNPLGLCSWARDSWKD